MKKVFAKTLVYLGIISSIIGFFFIIWCMIEGAKPDPTPEDGQIVLNGLGEALLLVFSMIASITALILYTIDNIINIISSCVKKKKGILFPIIVIILSVIQIIGFFLISGLSNIIIPIVYLIHLAIVILEIIMLIKYFKENKKAPL
jgi:hypothetical protein